MPAQVRRRLCLLGLLIALAGCTEKYFYYPDNVLYSTPTDAGLRYENVRFASADGTQLTGWFIPAIGIASGQARGTVLHFHGNAQNMSSHWRGLDWLPRRGYNVFVFDYRGYGQSQGKPEPQGVFEDSQSALRYIRSRPDIDPKRLLVFGQSLGGTNAIAAVGAGERSGVRAVVIESTFYSYSAIAGEKVSGAGLLMNDSYSAANYIAKLAPIPLLLIHGTADPLIPLEHSQRLFALAAEPKQLLVVERGGHLNLSSPRYQDAIVDFFEKALHTGDKATTGI